VSCTRGGDDRPATRRLAETLRLAPRPGGALWSRIEPDLASSARSASGVAAPPALASRVALWLQLALGALLLAYTLIRAQRLSFTHDEALTYFNGVLAPLADTLSFSGALPSNNHLLNSLLASVTARLGTDALSLRLPNLLAHVLYVGTALALASALRPPLARVLGFVVLTLHPFLLDFFAMCRGYGLACAFTLLSLYLLLRCAAAPRARPGLACTASLAAALAVLSNLSFLVFFFALVCVSCGVELLKFAAQRAAGEAPRLRPLLATLAVQLTVVATLSAYVIPIGLKLRAMNELYYGGEVGFLQDTLGTLLEASLYYHPYPGWAVGMLQALAAVAFVGALVLALRAVRNRDPLPLVACAVPLVTASICVVQHYVLGTKYPVDRTALFFVPMLSVMLVTASRAAPSARVCVSALGIAALLLSLNAARSLNFRYQAQWGYDAATRRMLEHLSDARGGKRVLLGLHWLFGPAVRYYREQLGLDWLQVARLTDECDYYYYPDEEAALLAGRRMRRTKHYGRSLTTLAEHAR
jgi:hypothetical protein